MELKDTINGMCSNDYKERFKAEYYQLKIRRDKLAATIYKYRKGELTFKPTCPIGTLVSQVAIMDSYLVILRDRAVIENIELL